MVSGTQEKTSKRKNKKLRVSKRLVWLKLYLDQGNPETFLNKQESARQAKYKTNNPQRLSEIGYQNSIALQPSIAKWLDDVGLSENALKQKLHKLVHAKETKFFQKDGLVVETREVEALEIQRRSVQRTESTIKGKRILTLS